MLFLLECTSNVAKKRFNKKIPIIIILHQIALQLVKPALSS